MELLLEFYTVSIPHQGPIVTSTHSEGLWNIPADRTKCHVHVPTHGVTVTRVSTKTTGSGRLYVVTWNGDVQCGLEIKSTYEYVFGLKTFM